MPTKPKVSTRARKYVQNKVAGMSDYQAAVKAGYSPNTAVAASTNIENPSVQLLIQELMDQKGMSDDYLLDKLQDGLDNSTRIFGTDNNFVETPDHAVRHKYLETAFKLKDKFPTSRVDHTTKGEKIETNTIIFTEFSDETEGK